MRSSLISVLKDPPTSTGDPGASVEGRVCCEAVTSGSLLACGVDGSSMRFRRSFGFRAVPLTAWADVSLSEAMSAFARASGRKASHRLRGLA